MPLETTFGVAPGITILTQEGCRSVREVATGTSLAHPMRLPSNLVEVTELAPRARATITPADRTSIEANRTQPLEVLIAGSQQSVRLDPCDMLDGGHRGRRLLLPRHEPYNCGTDDGRPLDTVDVAYAGIKPVVAVTITAADDLWIGQCGLSLLGDPDAAAQKAAS